MVQKEMRTEMKKQKGFSLIELLIVVAIILIIAAIAIPNLIKSKMAANEASAVGSLRTINTAELTYSSTYGTGFTDLTTLGTSGIVDNVLASGTKSGYTLIATPVSSSGAGTSVNPYLSYQSFGNPVSSNTGTRHFCSDESGVIRWSTTTCTPGASGSTALQ
jgi:type IV pilus assembly protein PilA